MKKYFSCVMAALLVYLSGVPANAANTTQSGKNEKKSVVKLEFDELEDTVRANNISIKAFDNTVKSVEETDVGDNYDDQYESLEMEIWSYNSQIAELDKAINSLGDDAAALRNTLEAQRSSLQSSVNSLQWSYSDLEDAEDDARDEHKNTIISTKRQTQNSADQLCLSAENTYISMQTVMYSIQEAERSIEQLATDISLMETRVSLGMAGENELKSLQSQEKTLQANLSTLRTQYENLMNTLALRCGYEIGTEIQLGELSAISKEQLSELDYDSDLQEALANSYSIWAKKDSARKASDDYANGNTNNLYSYKAAQIEYDAEKENVSASFQKLFKDVQEKKSLLDAAEADLSQAQKTFDIQTTKYQCGMISQITYNAARDTYTNTKNAVQTAEIDLFTAYNTYVWAKRGVMMSS